MKLLLNHVGVLSKGELDKPGCSWPWLLAARVLTRGAILNWYEIWDVLRWYAHNRGYDGNRHWARNEQIEDEDVEKVQNAKSLLEKYGSKTMAETVCKALGLDPAGNKRASRLRFKGLNAAFPREIVEDEVLQIFAAHKGKLEGVDDLLIRSLLANSADADAWRAIPCPSLSLPNRYQGGLLFGQIIPHFDNRIISICPVSGEKVPIRNTREFLDFRWAMQLANVRVARADEGELRPLSAGERQEIDSRIRETGYFTKTQFKQSIRAATGCVRDNIDTMLMHPDAEEALLVDPVKKLEQSDKLKSLWPLLPPRLQLRLRGRLRHRKTVTMAAIRKDLIELGEQPDAFDRQVRLLFEGGKAKRKKRGADETLDSWMESPISVKSISGRAPYARPILQKAFEEVMAGKHPNEEGGCLFPTESIRKAQLERRIEHQTNNHLVRHRLLILERLLSDILKEYAAGDKNRVRQITIEVNRNLREMSGMTAKEKAAELGRRLSNHRQVADKLKAAFENSNNKITPGLIRKARVADDLNWTCPYTGQKFEPVNLVTRHVDKDHVIPRSERQSDALEALVITFKAINEWKGKRTAWQFIHDEQGKPVPGMPNLSIRSLNQYTKFVEGLDIRKGHDDDRRRKMRRRQLMLLQKYDEPEFVPRDLTITSQLTRMGAQLMRRSFSGQPTPPVVVSLPGSVTGFVRRKWSLLGCIGPAVPGVLNDDKTIKTKAEIRNITHLHHAVDACVLGLASHFLPNNGSVWTAMTKRRLDSNDRRLLEALGIFQIGVDGHFDLRDLDASLKKQVEERLKERRVAQHIPASMDGLRVELNTWRVVSVKDGMVHLQQRMRQSDGSRPLKQAEGNITKVLGLNPDSGSGKLQRLKGALIIPDNYGVALDPEPTVIPFHKVWPRLMKLKKANGNKMPRVIRKGQLIQVMKGRYQGTWKVFSVKNKSSGICLALGAADSLAYDKDSVLLRSLLDAGLSIIRNPLTGMPECPITSSASTAPNAS